MKKILLKSAFASILLIILAISAQAQTTYAWTGANGTDWTTPGNWTVISGPAGTYPGLNSTDIVDIGVPGAAGPSDTTFVFTNQPTLAAGNTLTIASLTFGNNNAPTGTITLNGDGSTTTHTTAGIIILTVNGVLNVSGTVLQMHSPTGGGANSGTTTPAISTPGITTTAEYTSLLGAGTLHCGYFTVGDNTLPGHDEVSNVTVLLIGGMVTNLAAAAPHTITNPVESNITINIDHDFTMNTISYSNPTGTQVTGPPNPTFQVVISRNSDARVLFYQGTFNIGGMFSMLNNNATPAAGFKLFQKLYKPQNKFSIRPESDASFPSNWVTHPANFFYGGPFITFGNPSDPDYLNCVNKIDFYDNSGGITAPAANTNVNTSVVNYNGNNDQVVYSDSDTTHVDIGAFTYSQLIISGSGKKTVRPNGNYTPPLTTPGLTVNQTLLVTNLNTVGLAPTIFDLATNNANLWLSQGYTTTKNTIVNTGTGYVNLSSGNYTNNGTSNFGPGLVTYNAGSAAPNFMGNGITNYTNVKFMVGGAGADGLVTLGAFGATGTYNVLSTGVMQIAKHGTGLAFNTNIALGTATLNFLSDVNGSATLAALPGTCRITGTAITVQRYMSANRGYRLLSSPTIAGSANGNNIYTINYLLNTTYVSGLGFPTTYPAGTSNTGNPSLYLFRENLSPLYNTFLNSNYRGVASLAASPLYTFSPDAVNSDAAANIPVGNGYLCYFRGVIGTTTPFNAGVPANAGVLIATGAINEGNVVAHDWYDPTATHLGFTTVSTDNTIWGLNLLGNPYPSSIDWDTFGTGILENQLQNYCYKLIPPGLPGANNYDVYVAGTTTKMGTMGNANANLIASGEGFFVKAIDNTATLTFTEAAKTNSQATGGNLYMAKIPTKNITVPQYIRLQMAADTINKDGIIINFNSNAKTAFDEREDARYRYGSGRVNISSFTSDKVAVAINSLPLAAKGQVIPLRVGAVANGTYSLNTKAISGIPQQYAVWLKDAFTKDSVDMRKTQSYSFAVNLADTTTFGSSRFSVVINQDPAFAYKLLSFDASKVSGKQQVEVDWKTANEQTTTQFTVQRSTDNGKHFDDLGTTITSNGSGAYSFVDKEPAKGDNLYRLKQVDFAANTTLSSQVDVKISDNNVTVCVYPNPAVNNIVLTIDPKTQQSGSYKIKITNSTGTVVAQTVTKETNWQDNVSRLMTGTYLIQVVNENDNSLVGQTKFVKL